MRDELEPDSPVGALAEWLGAPPHDPGEARRALHGPVARVVTAFEAAIGLWDDATRPHAHADQSSHHPGRSLEREP